MNCHALADFETLDTTSNSIITEIGFLIFDPDDFCIIDEIAIDLDIAEQLAAGRTWSKDTIDHRRRNKTLPVRFTGTTAAAVVRQLGTMLDQHRPARLWSWGKDFDGPLFDSLFRFAEQASPFKYYDKSCARDAYKLAFGMDQRGSEKNHHALDDCRVALRDLRNALITLNRTPNGLPLRSEGLPDAGYITHLMETELRRLAGPDADALLARIRQPDTPEAAKPFNPFNPGITAAEAAANIDAFNKARQSLQDFATPTTP